VEIPAVKREDGCAILQRNEAVPRSWNKASIFKTWAREQSQGKISAVDDEGGDVKRNYVILGIALLGMSGAVLAQDPPAKTAPKKTAAGKGSATKGKEVFDQKCGICHFADSDAKKIGPGLKGLNKRGTFSVDNTKKVTDENLKTWIENGDSLMPPFKDVLDEQQIKDVIAYVKTL
jgi:mono/diheme cytochrome c family protein